jgi:hypothetical protein
VLLQRQRDDDWGLPQAYPFNWLPLGMVPIRVEVNRHNLGRDTITAFLWGMFAFIAFMGVVLVVTGGPWLLVLAIVGGAAILVVPFAVLLPRTPWWCLTVDPATQRLALQSFVGSRCVKTAAHSAAECRFKLHPARLKLDLGSERRAWILVLQSPEWRFACACTDERDEILAALERSPQWIQVLYDGEKEPLEIWAGRRLMA